MRSTRAIVDKTSRVLAGVVTLADAERGPDWRNYSVMMNVVVSYTGKTSFEFCHWNEEAGDFYDCAGVSLDQEAAKALLTAITREVPA